jgi:hypothetical protein
MLREYFLAYGGCFTSVIQKKEFIVQGCCTASCLIVVMYGEEFMVPWCCTASCFMALIYGEMFMVLRMLPSLLGKDCDMCSES